MITVPGWLPPLVLFQNYSGNWERYVEALYGYFRRDFIDDSPSFRGTRLALKRHPMEHGKEATFWHLISEGKDERVPDLRRCERIRWPRPIIEHADGSVIKVWKNKRKHEKRICIWFEDVEYLVILAIRKGYILLWTAYPVTRLHRKRKLQKEYEAYIKANAAPV
ncbi:MAG: hypothetical protein ISS49_10805 [Anaerolineae bacterium]|nr:hypothetical protein [Anaerolineae bacterium]